MWRFVSESSNGPRGWVMTLAFFVIAFGRAAGLVMAGMFNQDAITSSVVTRQGTPHAAATMLSIPGFVLASLLLLTHLPWLRSCRCLSTLLS